MTCARSDAPSASAHLQYTVLRMFVSLWPCTIHTYTSKEGERSVWDVHSKCQAGFGSRKPHRPGCRLLVSSTLRSGPRHLRHCTGRIREDSDEPFHDAFYFKLCMLARLDTEATTTERGKTRAHTFAPALNSPSTLSRKTGSHSRRPSPPLI